MLLELELLVISVTYAFASLDSPVHGSFAFKSAPYVNTIKIQKDLALQEDMSLYWPNGIVKYYVDKEAYDVIFGRIILTAIQIIQRSSCLIFMRMKNKPSLLRMNWIHITNRRKERECNHVPRFMDSGEIELVFGYDCLKTEEILHTLLHGIGFRDEVTHPHRDKYIRVLWDNIHPAYQHLYRKQAEKSSKTLVEYDPLSVMHFHDRAFSRNGQATIAPLEPGLLIYPSRTLSQLDKMRLKMYFGHECNKRKVTNLLQTCEKSLAGQGGVKMLSNRETQGAYSGDVQDSYDEENKTSKLENNKYITTENERLYAEDGRESDAEVKMTEEPGEDIEEQDVKDIEGELEESQNVKSQNIEDQDVERQDTEEQDADGTTTEGFNVGQNENYEQEVYADKKYDSENKEIENNDGEGTNDINPLGGVDEENEETTKGTNVDSGYFDETNPKDKLTGNTYYEKDISEYPSAEMNLSQELEYSEVNPGSIANVSYNNKMKSVKKQLNDSEYYEKNKVYLR